MEERDKKLRARRRVLLPFYVLVCGLAATALATYLVNENLDFRNRQQLKDARHQLERTIQSRMEAYLGLLRGGAGLFAANESVTLAQFRRFQQRLEVDRRYPGLQGFGYSVSFPPERLEELVESMREQGASNFNVWPKGERERYHSIVFLEPLDARNEKALGYDMFTEPLRREAMEQARDQGEPRLTRRVELVQELAGEEKQSGFLIYLPVYSGGDVPEDLEDRRSKLQGFVYSPFRAGDLFGGVVSQVHLPGLGFAVWDGTNKTSGSLLFQSNPRFDARNVAEFSRVEVTGSTWTIGVAPLDKSRPMEGAEMLLVVPLLGVIGSILLCYFTYTEGKARTRSEATANELFNQREWLQTTLRSIGDGVISTNLNGDVEFMNAAAEQLTGWSYEDAYGKRLNDIFPINNEETGKPTENPIERVLATGEMATLPDHTLLIDRRGTLRSIDDSAAPIRDRKGKLVGAILVFREISERRRYERRSTAQHEVTRVLAESPSLSEAAARVLERLCTTLQFEWGVLWLFDEQTGRAEAAYQWHRAETDGERFENACREFKPRKGEGLPGMVWAQGRPVWVKEFANDPRFPRGEDARALKIRTAFAFPVQSDSRQFGAIEFFRWETSEPDKELLNVMLGIGAQLGQFMQRKRAELALAESEALYRSISETAGDGIVVLDEQSRIVMANSATERIFGASAEGLVGTPIQEILPDHLQGEHDQDIRRLIDERDARRSWAGVEFTGLHRDGTEIPVEISFGVARHGDSHLFTGFIRDIRQRKEAERRLRETEERFTLLVRLAEEYAIIIMGPDGKITTWNAGAQRIFGYTDQEVVGKDGAIFFTAEDQAAGTLEKQLRTAEVEGQVLDERWQVRKDGSTFWASGSTVCLRAEDGTVRGFAKILRDITERKRMEMSIKEMNQELEIRVQRRTAALQESKEQMEAFSYTVAHDLRAPLRAMQGFAYTLMDEYQNMLDLAGSDYLRRIMSSAERMDALIQDLLEYSRLSGSELSFGPVALQELIDSVLRQYEQEIDRAGAEVQVAVEPLFVMAHAGTLENAIANLVANALKFNRPGVSPIVSISVQERGDLVQISVQDNGIGIAPEHHGRIFRVFERLHGVNKFPGTGIGLAMVKKGVERMGGHVGVESQPGEGSRFWIELPRAIETQVETIENPSGVAAKDVALHAAD